MRFFCQADITNHPYPDSLYRFRDEKDRICEEYWNSKIGTWEPTSYLTKLLTGGDCTLMQISEELANKMIASNSQKGS